MSENQRILLITRHLAPLTGENGPARARADDLRRLAASGHDVRAVVPASALVDGVPGLSPLIEALVVPDGGCDHPVGVKMATIVPNLPVYVLEGEQVEEGAVLEAAVRAILARLSWYPDAVLEEDLEP